MTNKEMDTFTARWEAEEAAKKQALLDKIDLVKTRIANKDKAIEELQYERKLVFNDLCNIISEELRMSAFNIFMGFGPDIFRKAWRWNQHRETVEKELADGTLTKDEYKSHKTAFDATVSIVKDKFFGDLKDKVKFKEIIMSWTSGYDYIFTYKKQEIQIFIPLFHADEKDWQYALLGYRASYKESDICNTWLFTNLDYKEVANKLQEWMLAEGWKQNV